MRNIAKEINELAEYGALHNEDCCVNFEDSRACEVGTPILGCCENIKTLAQYAENLVGKVIETMSYDMECKDEEQRKAVVEMLKQDLKENLDAQTDQ